MKYLKIFEGFDFGDYSEITVDEYDNPEGEMSHMTENNYSTLENLLELKGWKLRYKVSNSWEPSESNSDVYEVQFRKTIGIGPRESSLIITYMGDEWYYVLLFKGGELRPGNRNKRVYKADQIEGLRKFIDGVL